MKNSEKIHKFKQDMRKLGHSQNHNFLLNQMCDRELRRREFNMRERQYYKPHFGPEETDSLVDLEMQRRNNLKAYVKGNLRLQIKFDQSRKRADFLQERVDDLQNLNVAQNMYLAEEAALKEKQHNDQ